MIQLLTFTVILMSFVLGGYAIILNHNLRLVHDKAFVHSLFYYQALSYFFAVYGILGSLLIRIFLPKLGVSIVGIEVISSIIPFIGVPFLIAAWYMLLKVSADLIGLKKNAYLSIFYFVFTLSGFLAYGLVIKNMPDFELEMQQYAQQSIYLGYALIEFVIVSYVAIVLLLKAQKLKDAIHQQFFRRFALIVLLVSIMKSVGLYFSQDNFYVGLYFIMIFFVGNLPLILLSRVYMDVSAESNSKKGGYPDLFIQFAITPREKEVVNEICSGKTNQQIADTLFISLQTVKDHTSNIYRKVEVKNRVQLIQKFS